MLIDLTYKLLDEEEIVNILWQRLGSRRKDPYDDDVAWAPNLKAESILVSKCDMLVSSTDIPPKMSAMQIAKKAIVSSVSDFAAKGVRPDYCLVSIGLPRRFAKRSFVEGLARGFHHAASEYGLKILGGDTNATSVDLVIDATMYGYSKRLVKRSGAKAGDMVAVSGDFGHQAAGLMMLLNKAQSSDRNFRSGSIRSVLNPRARLDLGLKVARHLSSCIDSSDGLALSLYHLAESSKVNITLDRLPLTHGLETFAHQNELKATDLALFGGEEFELVGTFDPVKTSILKNAGFKIIGTVTSHASKKSVVSMGTDVIPRRGWIHFKS